MGLLATSARQAQISLDSSDQLTRRKRLGQIIVCAGSKPLDLCLFAGAGRKQENGYMTEVRVGPHAGQQAKAIKLRHHDVREYKIRLCVPHDLEGALAIR